MFIFNILHSSLNAQNDPPCIAPFLEKLGAANKDESGLGVYDAQDGNLYVTSITGNDSLTILKMSPQGTVIWSKKVNFFNTPSQVNLREVPVDLIVDQEGMLACYATFGNDRRAILFRYNPVTHTQLWAQSLILATHAHGLVQDPVNQHYMTYARNRENFSTTFPGTHASMVQINKQTGVFNLLPSSGMRFHTDTTISDHIRSMVEYNGQYYACGSIPVPGTQNIRTRHLMACFNLDGEVIWSRMGVFSQNNEQNLMADDLMIDGGQLVTAFSGNDGLDPADRSMVYLQKTSLTGEQLWVKKYDLGPDFPDAIVKEVVSVPEGYVLFGFRLGGSGLFFLKTDKNGALLWARQLNAGGTYLDDQGLTQSQLLFHSDALYFAAADRDLNGNSDLLWGRMCLNGELGIDCDFLSALTVNEVAPAAYTFEPTPMNKELGGQSVVEQSNNLQYGSVQLGANILCSGFICDTIRLEELIEFCPGDIISIAGQDYDEPGMVADTITGLAGCDTIITYTLQFFELPPSNLSLTCPASISVIANPGQAPLSVSYPLPLVQSDCPCPGDQLTLSSGLPSGGLFPNGVTQVCYQATDYCNQTATCCFNVQVREEQACDIKIAGCLKYELLNITADAAQNLTIKIRVTNNCSNTLNYTAIQLPGGVVADAPADNSVFLSENGNEYQVRNPNFSPIYSIRFKSSGTGIANGASDIFTYTLPAQAGKPPYIHVVSRLEPQLFVEAHLNTFNCPVVSSNRPEDRKETENVSSLQRVYPNPNQGNLLLEWEEAPQQPIHIQWRNALGDLVFETALSGVDQTTSIQLPERLPNGLYFLTILGDAITFETRILLLR